MKKILLCLTILLSTLFFTTNVLATSFNANIVGEDSFENEITLYVQVNDFVDLDGACNGVCGLVGDLSYDSNKLELVSMNALENFNLTQGQTLVLYKSTGVASGTKILSMTFKNKSLAKDEKTTITLSNIVASDGDKDIPVNNVSKTIKFVTKDSVNNNNQTNTNDKTDTNINNSTNNTDKNTSTKPTTNSSNPTSKKEETKKSNNNYLSSITLSEGSIKFDKDVFIYDVTVDNETSKIEVKAIAEDNKSTVTGIGNYDLKEGKNAIEITVKAEDASVRTYILNINREEKAIVDQELNVDDEQIKDDTNHVLPVIIPVIVLIVGIIGVVILKKKGN